jgi:hypothetical protein
VLLLVLGLLRAVEAAVVGAEAGWDGAFVVTVLVMTFVLPQADAAKAARMQPTAVRDFMLLPFRALCPRPNLQATGERITHFLVSDIATGCNERLGWILCAALLPAVDMAER